MSRVFSKSFKENLKKDFPALAFCYRLVMFPFRLPRKIIRLIFPEWSLESDRRKILEQYEKNSRLTLPQIEDTISTRYEDTFGRKLNWGNPQAYTEKIHVSKVYMSSPLKTMLADKCRAREWVKEKIGGEYLVPLLGVYDSFDEIDFEKLPVKFVIKCSHDSGSVTLVKDKSRLDMRALKLKYDFFMKVNYSNRTFEMHYRDIKPRIIIEQYLGDAINDYKFLCFDGRPCYCWVDFDRYTNHKRNIYNLSWKLQPFNQRDYGNYDKDVECPGCFEEMKRIVSILCSGFDHVRVDLYVVGGRIYFGEMTFNNGNGFEKIIPDEWDFTLGKLWPFDNSIRSRILSQSKFLQ